MKQVARELRCLPISGKIRSSYSCEKRCRGSLGSCSLGSRGEHFHGSRSQGEHFYGSCSQGEHFHGSRSRSCSYSLGSRSCCSRCSLGSRSCCSRSCSRLLLTRMCDVFSRARWVLEFYDRRGTVSSRRRVPIS